MGLREIVRECDGVGPGARGGRGRAAGRGSRARFGGGCGDAGAHEEVFEGVVAAGDFDDVEVLDEGLFEQGRHGAGPGDFDDQVAAFGAGK